MLKNLKKRTEGFTIIEVLIVLAIAGLIMLIVFLAVPTLQRNSRNTSKRAEVARLGAAANEFVTNNNGKTPVAADAAAIKANANLKDVTTVTVRVRTGAVAANLSTAVIETGAKCNGTTTAATGSSRNMAILFKVEGQSADVPTCQDV
jgi:type IV pilus assembly protein PilA